MCLHVSVLYSCPMSFGHFGNCIYVWVFPLILHVGFFPVAAQHFQCIQSGFSPVCLLVRGSSVNFSLGYCLIAPCFKHVFAGGGGGVEQRSDDIVSMFGYGIG